MPIVTLRSPVTVVSIACLATLACFASSVAPACAADPQPAPPSALHDEVWQVLKEKCHTCHNAKKHDGGLDMSSRDTMLKGGASGAAFVPGNVEKSLMIELIEFDEMPPRKQKERRVTADELKTLRAWIAAGAPPRPKKH